MGSDAYFRYFEGKYFLSEKILVLSYFDVNKRYFNG